MLTPKELETLAENIENASLYNSLRYILDGIEKDDLAEALRLMARVVQAFITIAKNGEE